MIRKLLSPGHAERTARDTKRNFEIQRIETFSDGVFAFALTLLIVSLEVPQSFDDLLIKMRGFFVFGICFLVLVSIWYNQHLFFRRYGMDDLWTVVLNGCLLFIVLFYIYPLKFLFTLLLGSSSVKISGKQVPMLMGIYASGFIVIYLLFFLMYRRAYNKSKELGLTDVEKFDCKSTVYKELVMMSIGFIALIYTLIFHDAYAGYSGFVYLLISPAMNLLYYRRNKIRKKMFPHISLKK
jgi:uncharacterized membrane protein